MKYLLTLLCAFSATAISAEPVEMHRGINILGFDSAWKGQSATFSDADFVKIKAAGFDTVRINIRAFPEILLPDNTVRLEWFRTMDRFVSDGLKRGFTVIIDYHDMDNKCSKSFDVCYPKLKAFWEQAAVHYRAYSNRLVFEPLNEPHEPITDAEWNVAQRSLLSVIRRTNPRRTVLVSPTGYSAIGKLKSLDLPVDANIATTIHYYEPRGFTMQFNPPKDTAGVRIYSEWGSTQDRTKLKSYFDRAKAWSQANKQKVFLGEFGVWDAVPVTSRAIYVEAVAREAERHGFGWAYWQYQHDFRATDPKTGDWLEPIRSALTGESRK